ncbi:MAG: hypothetical protein HS103_04955 [Anaerolineales bacterium]|nr:hypothetical protein [Anaerolineales bacterium]
MAGRGAEGGRQGGGETHGGVKTPALGIITPLGLKTEYTVRHLPSSPVGVVTLSPLL